MEQFLLDLIKKMIENTPNDQELGKKVRKLYNDKLTDKK